MIQEYNFFSSTYFIFGAGEFCKDIIEQLLEVAEVKGIIDNDSKKWGEKIEDIEVQSLEFWMDSIEPADTVICCCNATNYKAIKEQCAEKGIRNCTWFMEYRDIPAFGDFMKKEYDERLVSRCCTQQDFFRDDFRKVENELLGRNSSNYHRKTWEYTYITMILEQAGMLTPGKKGIGFAVGQEPLPCYFASKGCSILATDLGSESEQAGDWMKSDQNAGGDLKKLFFDYMCKEETFRENVSYANLDMNHIPENIGEYDFCWSSCAIEHVGGLDLSKAFLKNMLKVLKPGGIAIHTTEFNLSSNVGTKEDGWSVIFRKQDMEEYANWCMERGHKVELSFARGTEEGDLYVDVRPYGRVNPSFHLCLELHGYASTSFAIIVKKAE